MAIIIIILLVFSSSSCVNNKNSDSLPYDLPNECGTWVNLSDTIYESPYCLVEDSIYFGYLTLINITPREFFLRCKLTRPNFAPPLTGVDVESFEVNINKDKSPYARDKKSVYYPSGTVYGGGPEFFDSTYGGGELYYGDISIKGADPQTFQYIGDGYAIDKEHMYYKGMCIPWNENIIKKPSCNSK